MDNKKKVFIIAVSVVLAIFIWIFFVDKKTTEVFSGIIENSLPKEVEVTPENVVVYTMSQEERVYKYIDEIFNILNEKDYKRAYNLLTDDFKAYRFSTYESFASYMESYMQEEYTPKYKKFYHKDNMYVVYVELLKKQYTKQDLLDGIQSRFDTITIYENAENDYRFAINNFLYYKVYDNVTDTSGKLKASLISLVRNGDKSTVKFTVHNNYDREVSFTTLNYLVETEMSYAAISGYNGYRIRPHAIETIEVTYYLDYDSRDSEKSLVIKNIKVDDEVIRLELPLK